MKGLGGYNVAVTQSIKAIHSPQERHLIQTMTKYKGVLVCQSQIDCRSEYYAIWYRFLQTTPTNLIIISRYRSNYVVKL